MYSFSFSFYNMISLFLIIFSVIMQKIMSLEQKSINGKTYLVPNYNLFGCQQYMLPKLDNAPVHHTFFTPNDINSLYKQQNLDPQQLECNLKFNPQSQNPKPNQIHTSISREASKQQTKIKARPRPKLRESGFTHFVQIPLEEQIGEQFQSLIRPQVQEGNRDVLMHVRSLHATIVAFRMESLEDVPKWEKILKSINLKKLKVFIKGVDIFPIKKSYTRVVYLNINGLQQLTDSLISKAIQQNLLHQKSLQHIYFDKQSQTYKQQKSHVTIMKTKGDDLIDGAPYVKMFGKINFGKLNVREIRLSQVGTFDQREGYFDEVRIEG